MQRITAIATALLFGLSTAGYAAGKVNHLRSPSELMPDQLGYAESPTNEGDQKHAPFATQMGDYSLTFDTTKSPNIGPPDPGGVSQLREEPLISGFGFKLTKPLENNFWGFDGSSENKKHWMSAFAAPAVIK